MSPTLMLLLTPLLQGLVGLLMNGPAESWLIEHLLTFVAGHIARHVKLGPQWDLKAAVSDAASGTVTLTVTRDGRTAAVVVLEPLGLTAANQATLAALLGTLFHQGEEKLASLFTSIGKTAPAAPVP